MPLSGELRPYQVSAVNRFVTDGNLLVSLPTGTGKTVVAIAAAEHLLDEGAVDWVLVVCPPSLKFQWRRALNQFAPKASVLVVDGDKTKRSQQYALAHKYDYLIVSYTQVRVRKAKEDDGSRIARMVREAKGRVFVIGDEITAIKSFSAQTTRAMKALDPGWVMGLSAQPVENRPEEAFSIMEWIDPDVLGSFHLFDRTFIVRDGFGGVKRYRHLPQLHKKMSKAMVRHTLDDTEIAPYMPAHTIMEPEMVGLGPEARKIYRHVAIDLIEYLSALGGGGFFDLESHYGRASDDGDEARGDVMARLVALRMCCAHPHLLVESANNYTDDDTDLGSRYAHSLLEMGLLADLRPFDTTPKIMEALTMVNGLLAEDPRHKVVVFSYWRGMVALMTTYLAQHGAAAYHGGLNAPQKDATAQRFNTDPDCRVLVATDAGGYGLDLPAGSHMVHLDLPWSAGAYIQRCGRIIRLSSEWSSVIIANLLTEGTVEEFMWDGLGDKLAIASAVLDGEGFDATGQLTLQADQLLKFLKEARP